MATEQISPRCQLLPLPDQQVAFQVDGKECLRWHFGTQYPRPFFYPLNGPSGQSLTRMGHPGAPNHDHHRSVWFAHAKVLGINFWGDTTEARIRQHRWLVYQDGEQEAVMASEIGWYDGHQPEPLLKQVLVATLQPDKNPDKKGQYQLELQSTLTPTAETLELQQTNFGLLAVRVAKNLSAYFGGGTLTNIRVRLRRQRARSWRVSPISITLTIRDTQRTGMSARTAGWAPRFVSREHCCCAGTRRCDCVTCWMCIPGPWYRTARSDCCRDSRSVFPGRFFRGDHATTSSRCGAWQVETCQRRAQLHCSWESCPVRRTRLPTARATMMARVCR